MSVEIFWRHDEYFFRRGRRLVDSCVSRRDGRAQAQLAARQRPRPRGRGRRRQNHEATGSQFVIAQIIVINHVLYCVADRLHDDDLKVAAAAVHERKTDYIKLLYSACFFVAAVFVLASLSIETSSNLICPRTPKLAVTTKDAKAAFMTTV